jgi:hypothetical protein
VAGPNPGLPSAIETVVDRLAAMPGVVAVVLGGSRATGTATAASDWDLGVYYRGTPDLTALAALGEVHPPGSWGRLMNGGAWLTVGRVRVDALLRDLDAVERWTGEAQRGRFEIDGLPGYLAGLPTYALTAEVASSIVLHGELAIPTAYPEPLAEAAPANWRFRRDFSLAHARRAAELGNEVVALGQLARSAVEEAHARQCERRRWVLNEKRIFAGTGLPDRLPAEPAGTDVCVLVEQLAERLLSP